MTQTINNLEEAELFIYNYNGYSSKGDNQSVLYKKLQVCEQLAIGHNNSKLLCNTRIYLTGYYIQINDLEKALQLCQENKRNSELENLEEENLKISMRLIEIYLSLGDYANLEELIYEYNQKLTDKNDYSKLCSLNIVTAIQASNLKDYTKCLEANRKAVEFAILSKNINLMIYACNNMGYQFINVDLDISKEALEKALKLIETNKAPVYSIAVVELNSSRLYLKLKNLKLSNKLINSEIKKLKAINNNNELNYALLVLSEIYTHNNKYKAALKLLIDVEKSCIEHKNKSVLLTCFQNYIQLFEQKKKYKDALDYHKKYQALNEELFNEESNKKIRGLQILNEVNSIKKQRDHAETVANLKHDFLANMSHEIRTPINSVLGICYLLEQDELSEKQQHYIHRLQRSGENLLGLINDILDISKIEAEKMDLVPVKFNITTLLQDIYNQLSYKAEEKGLTFIADISPELNKTLIGDSLRLMQVVSNLVSNSIKFTLQGSVHLKATLLNSEKDTLTVQISVLDTGIGISSDKLEKIFDRYEQTSADIKTQFGGTGLGLSISKKLTELMGGSIEITSIEKKGTTFTLAFPFMLSDKIIVNKKRIIANTKFLNQKRILIADDLEENRLILKEILQTFNSSLILAEAENGNDVIQKISIQSFDLILMDLDMPEKNGLETMKEIRKSTEYKRLKIIAHSASLLSVSKDELVADGFNDLIQKPFKPQELLEKLQSQLK